ncbi:MAG: flagellar brake protein [Oscillospiraceae bacterium]|jgi:hypothetical protein|nr:flagellar brake protein [Oscillospiraceae bacterium]
MKPKDTYDGVFNVGERLELYFTDNNRPYKTVVQDKQESGDLVISSLYSEKEGGYIYLKPGMNITLVCYRETGRYMLNAKVVGLWNKNIGMVHITPTGQVTRQQRREWLRVPTSCSVEIAYNTPNGNLISDSVTSYNLSASGTSVQSQREYPNGAFLSLAITLAGGEFDEAPLELNGEVKSCMELGSAVPMFRVGIMFRKSLTEPFNEKTGGRAFERLAQFIQWEDIRLTRGNR